MVAPAKDLIFSQTEYISVLSYLHLDGHVKNTHFIYVSY